MVISSHSLVSGLAARFSLSICAYINLYVQVNASEGPKSEFTT
jgi:hypothetical protein